MSSPELDPDELAALLARKAAEDAVDFEYTHDLRHLIALVEEAHGEFPFDTATTIALTEYAVPLRYDELLDAEPLNRKATVALVNDVSDWATGLLDAGANS